MEEEIINRVAQSQLLTLNPADFFENEILSFDLKDFLYMELILKEKEFRAALKDHDWQQYQGKNVTIDCTTDAIVPMWAYMLVTSYLQSIASSVLTGDVEEARRELFFQKISETDFGRFDDKRIVLKGCGDASIPPYAYVALTHRLLPYAKSVMYGEACSTVPVYKKKPTPGR